MNTLDARNTTPEQDTILRRTLKIDDDGNFKLTPEQYAAFKPGRDGAQPTSRSMVDNSEEWTELGVLNVSGVGNVSIVLTYIFDDDETVDDNDEPLMAEDYPWDFQHIESGAVEYW